MATPYSITPEGFELQLATKYLGHWLFTLSIMSSILRSKSKRVILVSSSGHLLSKIRWEDPNFKEGYERHQA
jgi:NAD(P)-dependent dehydrogenase (short-subunit alcohol dehydrogenase family)